MPKTSEPTSLLLDTHIWFWLVLGSDRLRRPAREMIARSTSSGTAKVAAITFWEIALLASRNRIVLHKPTLQWIEEASSLSRVMVETLSSKIATECWELPGTFHNDPADRIIVATARITGATLMTRDRLILDYAAQGHLAAIPA